jgi:hypothetical protein
MRFVLDTHHLTVDEVLDHTSATARQGETSPLLPLAHDKVPSRVSAEQELSAKVNKASFSVPKGYVVLR